MQNRKALEQYQRTLELYDNDKPKLIKEYKRLIKEGQQSGDVVLMGVSYCGLSIAYYDLNDLDDMLTNAVKAVELLKDTSAYEMLAKAYINIGYVYGEQENHQMALGINDKAYQIIRTHRLKLHTRCSVINNLATSFHMLGDYQKGIKLLSECVKLTREEAEIDHFGLMMYVMNLAECYRDAKNLEKAKEILLSLEESLDKVSFEPIICDYYLRCAIISYLMGDRVRGNEYVDKSLPRVPKDIYPLQIYDDFQTISGILLHNGEMDRAKKIFQLMTVFARETKGTGEQLIAMRMMAEYYRSTGKSKKPLECYEKLEGLYEERVKEMKAVQLKVYQSIKDANVQMRKLRKKMQESEALLSIEPMTKLLNRSALLTVASEFVESAAQKRCKVGAIFVDIDFFKECNDTYGHAFGDDIIREVARTCQKEESKNIRFARYGGDEFFGITRGQTDEELEEIARRICRRIREADIPNEKNPNGQRVTLSVGIVNVCVANSGNTILEIAKMADKAVYHAKNEGRNAIYQLRQDCRDEKGKTASFRKIEF